MPSKTGPRGGQATRGTRPGRNSSSIGPGESYSAVILPLAVVGDKALNRF
jgi:hypothetical protein